MEFEGLFFLLNCTTERYHIIIYNISPLPTPLPFLCAIATSIYQEGVGELHLLFFKEENQ